MPKENLVGPLNGGWTVAKRLLQHERQGISGAAGGAGAPRRPAAGLDEMARKPTSASTTTAGSPTPTCARASPST